MADILVDGGTYTGWNKDVLRAGPVWTDKDTGYVFFIVGNDIKYRKTTDAGVTWASAVAVGGVVGVATHDIWFDKWTPGDSGALIHVWWTDGDTSDVKYRTLDTSDDSLGTLRTVFDGATFLSRSADRTKKAISGTKAVGGNLYVQFWGDPDGERGFYRSTDSGANWTSRTDGADGNEVDEVICLPDGNAADTQDIVMIYWDRSANQISIKKHDNSGNSWAETVIASSMADNTTILQIRAVYRNSDDHIILAAWSGTDSATGDLKVFDITISTPSASAKTDVVTDSDDCVGVGLFIDQNSDDLYCAYLGNEDGSETYTVTLTAFYKKSTDGGGTWGSQTAYQENAADDMRFIDSGTSTPGAAAGRFMPVLFNDDLNDLLVNVNNSVEIASGLIHRGEAVLSGVGSVAAVAALTLPAIVAFSGVGALVATGTIGVIHEGAAVLSGVGTLTLGTPARTLVGQASILGEGSLVAVGERGALAAAVLDGVGTLTVIGEIGIEGRAALAGVGSMSVLAQRIVSGAVALSGVGSLDVAGSPTLVGAATLSGVGAMTVLADSGVFIYTVFGEIRRLIDPADYPVGVDLLFEVQFSSPVGSETKARLFNITDATAVSGSELSTTSLTTVRLRTSALSLAAGAKEYRVEFAGQSGDIYNVVSADIIPVSS